MFEYYGVKFEDGGVKVEDFGLHPLLVKFFTSEHTKGGLIAQQRESDYFKYIAVCDDAQFLKDTYLTLTKVMYHVFNKDEDKWEQDFMYGIAPSVNSKAYTPYVRMHDKPFYLIRNDRIYTEVV